MEYKIHVDAGKEDCYWQYVHPKATIYVNMQVRTAVAPARRSAHPTLETIIQARSWVYAGMLLPMVEEIMQKD